MTPVPINFGSNRDIRRYLYFNYRKYYSKKYEVFPKPFISDGIM